MPAILRLPQSSRYQSLDIWRGVACLMIVFDHILFAPRAGPLPPTDPLTGLILRALGWTWLGVPLFFIISGYCISASCDGLRAKNAQGLQYFYRRFRRIYPPYWIALAVIIVAIFALNAAAGDRTFVTRITGYAPLPLSPGQWLGNIGLIETWRARLMGAHQARWDGLLLSPAWTLCYEEQFYAVCGVALLLAPRKFFTAMTVISAAVIALTVGQHVLGISFEGFFFDGRWLTFAAGALVYYRVRYAGKLAARALDVTLLLALAVTELLYHSRPIILLSELRTGFAFAVLLVLLYRWDRPMYANPLLAPLRICGIMCYSLYLVHFFVVRLTTHLCYHAGLLSSRQMLLVIMPIGVVAAVAAGWTFHVLVERRFLNTPDPPLTRHSAPAPSTSR